MPDDVILNKLTVIKRYVARIQEEYSDQPTNLENYTKQDSIILNLQRACEACIDVAMYLVSERNLGLPQSRGMRSNCCRTRILLVEPYLLV